jgi:hypothetical protein
VCSAVSGAGVVCVLLFVDSVFCHCEALVPWQSKKHNFNADASTKQGEVSFAEPMTERYEKKKRLPLSQAAACQLS